MSMFNQIKRSLSQLSSALASPYMTQSYCKRCGRRTQWITHFGRGYFRCTECNEAPGHGQ